MTNIILGYWDLVLNTRKKQHCGTKHKTSYLKNVITILFVMIIIHFSPVYQEHCMNNIRQISVLQISCFQQDIYPHEYRLVLLKIYANL